MSLLLSEECRNHDELLCRKSKDEGKVKGGREEGQDLRGLCAHVGILMSAVGGEWG